MKKKQNVNIFFSIPHKICKELTRRKEATHITLEITFGFPAFLCLLGRVWTWRGAAYFLCALLLHELGHYFLLCRAGVTVYGVRLGFGDISMQTACLGYGVELLCALAGPAVNLLLAAVFQKIAPAFAAVNLLLGFYNLLPLPPLDGGRAVSAGLQLVFPERLARCTERILHGLFWAAAIAALFALHPSEPEIALVGLTLLARTVLVEKNIAFTNRTRYNKK